MIPTQMNWGEIHVGATHPINQAAVNRIAIIPESASASVTQVYLEPDITIVTVIGMSYAPTII